MCFSVMNGDSVMKVVGSVVLAIGCSFAWSPRIAAADGAPAFQLGDLQKLTKLGNPQISPNGRQIAVIVSRPDWKTDKNMQEIDLVDAATGEQRSLTWKRTGIDAPHWSPDSTRLAFLAHDEETKQTQLFVMPMRGGDAMRVTDTKRGVDAFSWSPDGKQLAFVTGDEPANEKAIKAHDDAFQVTDNNFLVRAALTPWHLWVVPSAGGSATRLTQGSFSLQTDQQDAAPIPVWSNDGRRIVFTRFPGPYWGPSFRSVIASVDASGGEPQTLIADEGSVDFTYASTGKIAAYMQPRNGDQNNGNAVYLHENGSNRDITQAAAHNFSSYAWLPQGNAVLLTGDDGTQSALWEQPLTAAARKLDLGDVQVNPDVSVSNTGAIAFVGVTSTHPGELFVMSSARAKPRRLTSFNAFVDSIKLGHSEPIEWNGPNGFKEDGVLTYPTEYIKGHKYPLVLVIHGGPEEASTMRFSALPQLLSAAGFVVFQPNYRGSTNLGDAYQHAIFRDTGTGPGKDVMAGLAAVEKLGIVDETRIGVTGWSYGGYMTTWLTGHYGIWKAAVSGAALTDWVMDYTVAYYQQGDTYYFGGSPWVAKYRDIWREQSPISYAQNVTAPTLIMGDVGDPNVPLLNSYEWYHALRDNGVPVEFFAYPVNTHFPSDIVRTTDVYRRWVGWMTSHL
jgi:dipeptidyl aminopeptidase/acylaminoacyl peptidase